MKFNCNTDQLANAFTLLGNIASGRSPRQTLNNIKLETKGGELELAATDSEIAVRYRLPDVSIAEEGSLSIPVSNLATILRETVDETVDIEQVDGRCEIRSKDSVYRVFADDPHNFPFIPVVEPGENSVSFPTPVLLEAIQKTAFASARERTRYALNGVLFKIAGGTFEMVATDGKRLARIAKPVPEAGQAEVEAILPKKVLELLDRVAGDAETVQVDFHENVVQFQLPQITLCAKLVEGSFPKYSEVIPADFEHKVTAKTAPFFSAVRRASLFTNEESKALSITFTENLAKISSHSDLTGEAKIELPMEYTGAEMEISLNSEFLADVLRVTTAEEFCFELTEANAPVLIRSESDYLNVIMPISSAP